MFGPDDAEPGRARRERLVYARNTARFWQEMAQAGILITTTEHGWMFDHRAVPPPDRWQPVPYATRETALVSAIWLLLRSLHAVRTDLDRAPPARPAEPVSTQPDDYYRQTGRWPSGADEAGSTADGDRHGWFYTQPFLPRPAPDLDAVDYAPPPGFTCWGPYVDHESALVDVITDLLAQFDALQRRAAASSMVTGACAAASTTESPSPRLIGPRLNRGRGRNSRPPRATMARRRGTVQGVLPYAELLCTAATTHPGTPMTPHDRSALTPDPPRRQKRRMQDVQHGCGGAGSGLLLARNRLTASPCSLRKSR